MQLPFRHNNKPTDASGEAESNSSAQQPQANPEDEPSTAGVKPEAQEELRSLASNMHADKQHYPHKSTGTVRLSTARKKTFCILLFCSNILFHTGC